MKKEFKMSPEKYHEEIEEEIKGKEESLYNMESKVEVYDSDSVLNES
jgi:hypothetical protein